MNLTQHNQRSNDSMNQLRIQIANVIIRARNNPRSVPFTKYNNAQIAKWLGCDQRIVREVRDNLRKNLPVIHDYKKKDNFKITPTILLFIEARTLADRIMSSQRIADEIQAAFNVNVTRTTVDKYRHKLGFKYMPKVRTFVLIDEHKAARLDFATKHLNDGTDFSNYLFTDESYFELGSDNLFVWRRPGERSSDVMRSTSGFPTKVMVWGGISARCKSKLIVFEVGSTMDAKSYISEVLKGACIQESMDEAYDDWWFMQDNASCHSANITNDFLTTAGWKVLPWPAHSPDLNIIEQVWAWMKRRVYELQPKTVEDLNDCLLSVWDSLTFEHIRAMVDSIPKRLRFVQSERGAAITKHL